MKATTALFLAQFTVASVLPGCKQANSPNTPETATSTNPTPDTSHLVMNAERYVSTIEEVSKNTAADTVTIRLNVSWPNSWRNSTNYDGVWLFLKHRVTGQPWRHTSGISTNTPAGVDVSVPAGGHGVFIYRATDGTGNMTVNNLEITWNYGGHGIADNATIEMYARAIEMVYVPQGAFFVGDGASNGTFRSVDTNTPQQITSENALPFGGITGTNLTVTPFGPDANPDFLTSEQTLPAAYPKGFAAFWCMKYEISQGLVVDFLNMGSSTQATLHTTGSYINAEQGNPVRNGQNRNTISGAYPNFVAGVPSRPSGFIRYWLFMALADWTALRPMTELEWEKANRGPEASVAGQLAWGNTTSTVATGVSDDNTSDERASNSGANVNSGDVLTGPLRSGWQSGTTRQETGASYWGIRDLCGNVWERVISINSATGRSFTGNHGDGEIDNDGYANVGTWPGAFDNPHNIAHRGGAFNLAPHAISDRAFSTGSGGALSNYGGRFVRTGS